MLLDTRGLAKLASNIKKQAKLSTVSAVDLLQPQSVSTAPVKTVGGVVNGEVRIVGRLDFDYAEGFVLE